MYRPTKVCFHLFVFVRRGDNSTIKLERETFFMRNLRVISYIYMLCVCVCVCVCVRVCVCVCVLCVCVSVCLFA